MRPRAQLEHDRRQPKLLDRGPRRRSLGGQLAEGGGDEDTDALVRRPNRRRSGGAAGVFDLGRDLGSYEPFVALASTREGP
jgi:hypothetical protein